MIEFGTGANRTTVECLTLGREGTIELQLHSRYGQPPRMVILGRPSLIEFARLRVAAMDADTAINDLFPEPHRPPDVIPGETDMDRVVRLSEYQKTYAKFLDDRHNYRTHPDHAPYANVLLEVVKTLSDETVTLDDLLPETAKAAVLQALLEMWETPLGGAVSAVVMPPTPTVSPPEADSPESTPSSPPTGTPSPPSPPPSSTP